MLSALTRTPERLKITLVLALLYWLDIFLLSLPAAAARTPDFVVPLMMAIGLPILAGATWFTLRSNIDEIPTRA